jgi:hypothetical protein
MMLKAKNATSGQVKRYGKYLRLWNEKSRMKVGAAVWMDGKMSFWAPADSTICRTRFHQTPAGNSWAKSDGRPFAGP